MLKTKTAHKTSGIVQAAAFSAALGGGFFLADASITATSSFADISLSGALPLTHSAAVLGGSLLRSIAGGTVGEHIVKLSAMILIVIFKLFFESKTDERSCGISAAVSVFISGIGVSAIIGDVLQKLVFYAFYAALTGFTSYSIAVVAGGLAHRCVIDLTAPKSCAYAVVYAILTASLCSVKIPYINLGIIFGTAVTVTAAYHYRYIGGVLCGAITTCGAFLASPECGMTVVLLPAAGLLTGYLYKQKAGIAAGFFVAVSFTLMVFTGITAESLDGMLNIISGTVIFLAVSPNFSDKWVVTGKNDEAFSEIIGSRMHFLANSIENVRSESVRIADFLARTAEKSDEIENNSSAVCKSCYRRLECWYNCYENTRNGFRKLSQLSEITRENFPFELADCLHKSELSRAFEKTAHEKTTARLMSMRFSDSRKLLFEQIKITEEIIKSAGERIDVRYSESLSRSVRAKLKKYSYAAKNVIAYYNNRNRLLIELYFASEDAPSGFMRVCDLISDELRLPLDSAEPVHSGKEVRVRLFERPPYSLEAYGASVCADSSNETGDSTSVFSDGTGISYVILSDGMGTGKSASLESRMVVSMFRKLISSGVNYTTAIRLINSIMVTKSQNEAFATLDAVRINLDTRELTVIKSGATATLIRHRGQVMKITSPTFPIGIFQESDTFFKTFELEENDIIVMFSDGINENEYRFIKELLLSSNDLKTIVDEICGKAELFNPDVHDDDVTVIGIKLTESHIA